jgi:hypothetical protein
VQQANKMQKWLYQEVNSTYQSYRSVQLNKWSISRPSKLWSAPHCLELLHACHLHPVQSHTCIVWQEQHHAGLFLQTLHT